MTERRNEFQIHKANLGRLDKRVARLARKAERYGLPVPSYEIVSEGFRPEQKPAFDPSTGGYALVDTGRQVPIVNIVIHGETPSLEGGWRLVAVIDHRVVPHEDLGWPIYSLPWVSETELSIPSDYHTAPPWCDHCDTYRDRAETFLIVNDDGEWKRVGRTCLKDYSRGVPLHAYAAYLYDLPQLALGLEDEFDGERGRAYVDTETYLAHVISIIDEVGWRSRADAYGSFDGPPATADQALEHLLDREDVTDEQREKATAALEWARDVLAEKDDLNEYEYNLVIAASQQATAENRIGLVASLPRAYERFLLDERLADESNSTHQGEIGERLDLTLTVTKRLDIEIDAFHGRGIEVLKIHVFQDGDGNVFLWKTTSQKLAEGETYTLRGTVKEHDEYKGIPQTVLTRCSKIAHEPCGEFDYWFDRDGSYHCAACEKTEDGNG